MLLIEGDVICHLRFSSILLINNILLFFEFFHHQKSRATAEYEICMYYLQIETGNATHASTIKCSAF